MQPYFFPYIGYFQLVNAVDKFIVYDDVNYIKNGWINRNKIIINGKEHYLTIPLKGSSSNIKISELIVAENINWRKILLKQIMLSYGRAENFKAIFEMINRIISNNESSIVKIILQSIREINSLLSISTEIVESSSVYKNNNLKGEERIIEICRKERADFYLNPIGGVELYNSINFKNRDIELRFIKTGVIHYKQFSHEFVANMSIIDVLMHNDINKVKEFLHEYELLQI